MFLSKTKNKLGLGPWAFSGDFPNDVSTAFVHYIEPGFSGETKFSFYDSLKGKFKNL